MNLDSLNSLNTLINLIILITLNPDKLAPSKMRLNKNGIIASKSIKFNGDKINSKNFESKAVELNILNMYSKPKNMNR